MNYRCESPDTIHCAELIPPIIQLSHYHMPLGTLIPPSGRLQYTDYTSSVTVREGACGLEIVWGNGLGSDLTFQLSGAKSNDRLILGL